MPQVAVVMGSRSDWPTMKQTVKLLETLGVTYEKHVISAHRMPEQLQAFGQAAQDKGLQVIIAGAGGAAHLPGNAAILAAQIVAQGQPAILANLVAYRAKQTQQSIDSEADLV